MMVVRVLAFGIVKDIFGSGSVDLRVGDDITVQQLSNLLSVQYPRLQQISSFRIAVNSAYAKPDDILMPGHEVALIPPVSGG